MSQAGRAGRRLRRLLRSREQPRGLGVAVFDPSAQLAGPEVVMARPEQVLAALETMPAELSWPDVSALVLPLLERVRPYPPGTPPRAQMLLPPGVIVGFGIDIGPAFVSVSRAMVERWGISPTDVAATSLANLHSRAAQISGADVLDSPLGYVSAACLQAGRGIGSTLVLAPSELARIFGPKPRCFIAPMRSVLVGLPIDADRVFVRWVFAEFASNDPNHLHPLAFAFDGSRVAVEPLD